MSYNYNNNGPWSNREALGEINYMNWREHLNEQNRIRRDAVAKRKALARNALAAQMITTGRGPKPPSQTLPYEHHPLLQTAAPAPRSAEPNASTNNITRSILAFLSTVPVPEAPVSAAPAAVGGAGADPSATSKPSHLAVLPNDVRSKIASYLSGVERNHLRPIKAKIARETAKIISPRKRKNKTRRRI